MAEVIGHLAGSLLHGSGKILLVCAGDCDDVQETLASAGCNIATVVDGGGAVSRATREFFDVALVVSTGRDMDLAETVLNLRDVSDTMQIVIIADRVDAGKGVINNLVHAVPHIAVLTQRSLLDTLRTAAGGC